MSNKNDRWSALSMKERADLIKLYVNIGITSLDNIKKDYNSFGDGGDTDSEEGKNNQDQKLVLAVKPSLETYLKHKIDSTRNAAYEKSVSRNIGIEIPYTLTPGRRQQNEYNIEILREIADTSFVGPVIERTYPTAEDLAAYYSAVKELENNCEYGLNCIGTATDNYPEGSRSNVNTDFAKNHERYGFIKIPLDELKKGDIVQANYIDDFGENDPFHGMIFAGYNDRGKPLFNYSRGGTTEWDYVKGGKYPINEESLAYTYIGTPELRTEWEKEYRQKFEKKSFGGIINRLENGGSTIQNNFLNSEYNIMNQQTMFDTPYLFNNTTSKQYDVKRPLSPTVGEDKPVENIYKIVSGDSLGKIAKSNNVPLESLIKANPQIKNPNMISVGQDIVIPQQEIRQSEESKLGGYEVQAGDTLSKIASKNNISLNQLISLNPQIKDINSISIGQKINLSNSAPKVERQKQWINIDDLRSKEAEYNKTNLGAIQGATHDSNYVVIDKKGKKLTVYDSDNNVVYETSDISTGLSGNDYNTKTFTRNGKDVYGEGNMSTPAGVTRISSMDMYHGAPSFQRVRLDSYGNPKKVYDKNGKEIDDTINSSFHLGSIDRLYSSNGCVRMSKKALNDLSKYIDVGTLVYTLPDKNESRFVLKDGNLNYEADNPFGVTEKGKTFNKYGHDMVYQDDYNVFNNKTSSPIKIEYTGNTKNPFKKDNIESIISGITSNKESLQKAFNVSDQHFNKIAQLALGILEQESKFGTHYRYIGKQAADKIPFTNSTATAIANSNPNSTNINGYAESNYHGETLLDFIKHVSGNNTYDSLGMGQIKMEGDNEETQKMYRMFNVTPENVRSDEKTAEAIMIRLLSMYRNEVQGREFKNKETGAIIDPYDALLYKYKGGTAAKVLRKGEATGKNTYVLNVKNYAKDFKFYTYK